MLKNKNESVRIWGMGNIEAEGGDGEKTEICVM